MDEQELVELGAERYRLGLPNPSAEDLVCAYLVRRGYVEPKHGHTPSPETRDWFRRWTRLCDRIVDRAKAKERELQGGAGEQGAQP